MQIPVHLIGAGNQSENFLLPALRKMDRLTPSSITARSRTRSHTFSKRQGLPLNSSVKNLFSMPDPKALVAATSPLNHLDLIKKCSTLNIPIYVEKPPATTFEALKDWLPHAQNPYCLYVGFNQVLSWSYLRGKAILKETMSDLKHINIQIQAPPIKEPLWGLDLYQTLMLASGIHGISIICDLIPEILHKNVSVSVDKKSEVLVVSSVGQNKKTSFELEVANSGDFWKLSQEWLLSSGEKILIEDENCLCFSVENKHDTFKRPLRRVVDADSFGYGRALKDFENSIVQKKPDLRNLQLTKKVMQVTDSFLNI